MHVAVKVLCLTDLANTLYKCGERTGIRTPDTRLRRALLYPAELCTHIVLLWSGKRDSNSRLQPWQGCALPLNYSRSVYFKSKVVRVKGVEPPRRKAPDPKSGASANSATSAHSKLFWWRMVDSNHRNRR